MKYFSFQTSVIKWFKSFLSNIKFLVFIDNAFSDGGTLKCSVPQGSIFGSPFCLLYVNHLHQSLSEAGSYLYADDTCIFYQKRDVTRLKML